MAEQRLIDANNLGVGKANPDAFERKDYAYGWNSALQAVTEASPTIDPETIPIVCKLREREKDLEGQLSDWKFWWGPVREHEAEELREKRAAVNVMRKRCEKTIAELRTELRRVTAERDAAQRLLAEHTGVVGMEKVTTCFGCPLEKVLELVLAYRDGRLIIRQEKGKEAAP